MLQPSCEIGEWVPGLAAVPQGIGKYGQQPTRASARCRQDFPPGPLRSNQCSHKRARAGRWSGNSLAAQEAPPEWQDDSFWLLPLPATPGLRRQKGLPQTWEKGWRVPAPSCMGRKRTALDSMNRGVGNRDRGKDQGSSPRCCLCMGHKSSCWCSGGWSCCCNQYGRSWHCLGHHRAILGRRAALLHFWLYCSPSVPLPANLSHLDEAEWRAPWTAGRDRTDLGAREDVPIWHWELLLQG